MTRLSATPNPKKLEANLNENEWRLLEVVSSGLLNKEVAAKLGLAEKTVRNQLTRVFDKLGVATRTETALWFERKRSVIPLLRE